MSEELKPFQRVLARDENDEEWHADLFSHIYDDIYICVGHPWRVCLPYNDETKHLLGTTDSPTPSEPEFKWGDHVEVRDNTSVEWRKAVYIKTVESDNFPYIVIVLDNSTDTTLNFKYRYCRHADW